MNFRVVVQNTDGTQKWEIPYDSFSFTEELNRDRNATFNFTEQNVEAIADVFGITVEFLFSASYREIYIFDEDNNRIYGGYIAEPSVSKTKDGLKTRTITSKGFFSLLEKRLTNVPPTTKRFYASDNASDIAWDLINYTQSLDYGNLGITRGADPADVNNQRTYRYVTIKQAIEKLSNTSTKDGIDFEITPTKVFNAFFPEKGSLRDNLILQDGFNIQSYSIKKNFIDAMVNQVVVFGKGDGDAMITSMQDSETTYKENYFLLQGGLSEKDTEVQDNLDRKGQKHIETYKYPKLQISLTCTYESPLFTEYSLGDSIPIVIPDESVNSAYRLRQRTCNNEGNVTLTFIPQ